MLLLPVTNVVTSQCNTYITTRTYLNTMSCQMCMCISKNELSSKLVNLLFQGMIYWIRFFYSFIFKINIKCLYLYILEIGQLFGRKHRYSDNVSVSASRISDKKFTVSVYFERRYNHLFFMSNFNVDNSAARYDIEQNIIF